MTAVHLSPFERHCVVQRPCLGRTHVCNSRLKTLRNRGCGIEMNRLEVWSAIVFSALRFKWYRDKANFDTAAQSKRYLIAFQVLPEALHAGDDFSGGASGWRSLLRLRPSRSSSRCEGNCRHPESQSPLTHARPTNRREADALRRTESRW